MKTFFLKLIFSMIVIIYLCYTFYNNTNSSNYYDKKHDSILINNNNQREIITSTKNNKKEKSNSLIDTNSIYKEYIGRIGNTAIKLHLFKNRRFENLYTGSYYTLGGNNFKLIIGGIKFIVDNSKYESSYYVDNMAQEIKYRNTGSFIDEYISLNEDNNEDITPAKFKGKIDNKGLFNGYIYRDDEIIDRFYLKEESDFYPNIISCYDTYKSIEGVIPSIVERNSWIEDYCINVKSNLLSDSTSLLISDNIVNEIYSSIDSLIGISFIKCSYSVVYNEGVNLAIAVNIFKDKQKHNAYSMKIFNYNLKGKRLIEKEDIFINNYKNKLLDLINNKIKSNGNKLDESNNYIVTNNGIVIFLKRQEKPYYSQYGRGVFLSYEELKGVLKK